MCSGPSQGTPALGYFISPKVSQIYRDRGESCSVGFTELNDIYFFQKKLILDMSDRVLSFALAVIPVERIIHIMP